VLAAGDRARLAAHLGMSLQAFIAAHVNRRAGKFHLGIREDGFCIFFHGGCSVHPARPDICRAWPYFRGNLLDASSWAMSHEYCPGINLDIPHEEFVRQGLEALAAQDVGAKDDPEAPNALRLNGIAAPAQNVPSSAKCE